MKQFRQIQIILALYLIGSCSCMFAQTHQFTGSVLWKVSGNGLTESSYIFGTNHILSKAFLSRIDGLDDILNSCQQVVGEIDMNEGTLDLSAIRKASLLPEGKTYSQLLDKTDYNKLDSVLQQDLKIRLSQVENISPVTILTMYTVNLYNKISDGGSYSENMDNYFQEYARTNSKEVVALETLDQQIQYLFYSKSLNDQINELLCVISSHTIEKEMKELDQSYQNGDLIDLERLMNEDSDCSSGPEEREIIYKNRNDDWLEKLPRIMADKTSFIAVGCLHLVGEDGLLNKLSLMGYHIEPIGMQP